MEGYKKCVNCGAEVPQFALENGLCYICFDDLEALNSVIVQERNVALLEVYENRIEMILANVVRAQNECKKCK